MKYKFDVLVILNDESRTVALDSIRNQLAQADHINKIFIGNTRLYTLQVIASEMEQQTPAAVKYTKSKSASGRRVTHSVQAEKPVILGLRDAEFNVLKDSPNPVVVIGTPDELGEPKTRELVSMLRKPASGEDKGKQVIELIYKPYTGLNNAGTNLNTVYINLLFTLNYLSTLQVTVHGKKQVARITMFKYKYDKTVSLVNKLNTNIAKTPKYREINRAYEMITLGIKENRQKHQSVTTRTESYNTPKELDINIKGFDNILIISEQLYPKLEAINWNILNTVRIFLIVITPEKCPHRNRPNG